MTATDNDDDDVINSNTVVGDLVNVLALKSCEGWDIITPYFLITGHQGHLFPRIFKLKLTRAYLIPLKY